MMHKYKKVLLLVNSASGVRNAVTNLFGMIRLLTDLNCLVTVYPIVPSEGLVSENIPSFLDDEQYDVIACCGGDGTLNHVVNVMMKNGIHLPIGYIPTGSTNDFSRSMNRGAVLTMEEQCRAIAGKNTFSYDVGRMNDTYFNYIAAFGAFTKVSYDTPQKWKNAIGYGAYVLNLIGSIPEGMAYRRHVRYEYDGGVGEGDFIFGAVSNTLSIGGMRSPLVSHSKLNDGLFEVILISAPNSINDLNVIIQKMSTGDTDDVHVIRFQTSHIVFTSDDPMVWTLDGEECSGGTRSEIRICPRAAELCVKEESQ